MTKLQKGICVESKGNRSIYMAKNGQFIIGQPADPATAVGGEGYFYPQAKKFNAKWKPVLAPIAAAVAVLFLFLSVLLPTEEAFAYVQVEVNPAMEIGVDKDLEVISIRSLNTDGRDLIEQLGEWENQALDEILTRTLALSLNDATKEVTITTVAADKGGEPQIPVEKMVMAATADVLAGHIEVHLKQATREQWRQSVKESVPVGQKIDKSIPIHAHGKQVQEDKPRATDEKNSNTQPKIKKVPDLEKKKVEPAGEQKKESGLVPKVKKTPPGQQKKIPASGQEKNTAPHGQEKKAAPHEKEKSTTPGRENKVKAPRQEKSKAPKTKVKKEAVSPNKNGKKDVDKQKQKDRAPGQMKKEETTKAGKEKSKPSRQADKQVGEPSKKQKKSSPRSNKNPGKD